jgi:O-antigen/teichoic acid export membrane protein
VKIVNYLKNSTLLKNTFIYTLLQIFNRGIPFLLIPVLTRFLTPKDYGLIATFNTFMSALVVFIGLSTSGAVSVNFFHMEKEELKKYIGNIFIILFSTVSIVILLVTIFEPYLISKLKLPVIWIYIAIPVALTQIFTDINLALWRVQQKAKPFAIYYISQTLFNISLSLLLVITLHYGWQGRVSGITIAKILFGVLSVIFIYKRGYGVFNYSLKHIKDALKFGIPLIPHQVALWLRSGMNIILITSILGVKQTGVYTIGMQFGMVVFVFASAFNNAYSPYLYEKLKNINLKSQKNIVKFTYLYFAGIVIFAMGLSTFFVLIIPYFLGQKFQGASKYIYWISLAYAIQGMYLMVVNYIFFAKKNHLLSMVTIITSVLHVGLSYTLIHKVGAIGAAYASVVSSLINFILVWYLSNKVFSMPWFKFKKAKGLI